MTDDEPGRPGHLARFVPITGWLFRERTQWRAAGEPEQARIERDGSSRER